MAGELRPGPASMAGLEWLVRVGSAPIDAWRCAMGWDDRVARSHVSRLEREGWLERHPMFRGDGSLLVATRRGVRMTGLAVSAPAPPEPTWWAHDCACAWTAAWLTVRGAREWSGPREVLANPELKGTVVWSSRVSLRRSGHRPDLAVCTRVGLAAVEVELQRKDTSRMEGILSMYRGRIDAGKLAGVVYVCGSDARADRVYELANKVGIPARALRIELLSDVREEAECYGSRSAGAAQAAPAARER
jgi:hypothetical protein